MTRSAAADRPSLPLKRVCRVCFAMALNRFYVDVALRRWELFTGRKATLQANGKTFEDVAKEREIQLL